jgi:hypothetical protein
MAVVIYHSSGKEVPVLELALPVTSVKVRNFKFLALMFRKF